MIQLSRDEIRSAVGITTTVPMEIVYAAGRVPVDLNNIFITSGETAGMVAEAERAGFPRNSCAWTKGCFAAARRLGLRAVVVVTEGDCSSTHALGELLAGEGVEVTGFAFPFGRDRRLLRLHMERFADAMGTTMNAAEDAKARLDPVRALARRIDALCWREHKVCGDEAHLWQISCSDFNRDPGAFADQARRFIEDAAQRRPEPPERRIALVGIPPICEGLFGLMESLGARVVFNEVPRQFTMPSGGGDLVDQYARYTYPYDIFGRIDDIVASCADRRVDGIIHYVQSFCFRQVQDVLIRRALGTPILTLECDRPGPLDARARTRIEAFIEMLPPGGGEG